MESYLYNMNQTTGEEVGGHIPPAHSPVTHDELRRGIAATRQFFFNHQHPDGYWVAELEGDALLQSETIMLLAFLGEEETELAKKCAVHLLDTQNEDGGWGMYTGGKSDANNTVKAYFALKLTGHDPAADYMQRARVRALELGGVDKVNSFTRFYLAILGQIPHHVCPAVPPQMMFLPNWFPINIYEMSAWSRTIFVPLSIVSALQPVRKIPEEKGIREIFVKPPEQWGPLVAPGKIHTKNPFSWDFFFRCCNSAMWFCRKIGLTPFRKTAIEKAKQWTIEHCKKSDGPGAIYPPIVWAWIAFKALGYADDSSEVQYCRKQLNDLVIRNDKRGSVRVQPCKSPVWDTALTLKALMLGGLTVSHPAVRKGVQWVRSQHIKDVQSDWMVQWDKGRKEKGFFAPWNCVLFLMLAFCLIVLIDSLTDTKSALALFLIIPAVVGAIVWKTLRYMKKVGNRPSGEENQNPLSLWERVRVRGKTNETACSPHPSPLPEGEGTTLPAGQKPTSVATRFLFSPAGLCLSVFIFTTLILLMPALPTGLAASLQLFFSCVLIGQSCVAFCMWEYKIWQTTWKTEWKTANDKVGNRPPGGCGDDSQLEKSKEQKIIGYGLCMSVLAIAFAVLLLLTELPKIPMVLVLIFICTVFTMQMWAWYMMQQRDRKKVGNRPPDKENQNPLSLWERVRVRGGINETAYSPHPSPLPEGEGTTLPNGWCFEFNNPFYPDCDDTAMALMVLLGRFDPVGTGQLPADLRVTAVEHAESLDEAKQNVLEMADTTAALQSGLRWLLGMQNKDGGWAAFDRDNNKEFLCKVPFADHNAMIDPSTPDLTGRVMESLGRLGFRVGQNPEIDRVVAYMRKQQQADGSWFGRWGVNYIYGTWQALTGLTAVGVPADDPAITAGANWLLTHQHASGGWGESPDTYEDPALRGSGTPTASQTAWAVMGLIAAGKTNEPAVVRGIRFLLDRQRKDGTWFEPEFTGTGFPLVFYLKYHYYSVYFPLMALSLYASKQRVAKLDIDEDEAVVPMHRLRIFSPETGYYNNSREDDPPPSANEYQSRNREIAQEKTESKPVTLRLFLG